MLAYKMATGAQDKERNVDRADTDKGWAWVVAVAGMMIILLSFGTSRTLGILMVELTNIYGTSTTEVSLTVTYLGVGIFITALLFMVGLGDFFHERALVMIGGLLTSVGFIVTYFSRKLEDVYVLGFLVGTARPIAYACSNAMVGKYFTKRLAIGSGIVMAGSSLGVLLLSPFIRWLIDEFAYRGAALIMAAISLNLLVFGGLLRPKVHKMEEKVRPHVETDTIAVQTNSRTSFESSSSSRDEKKSTGHTNPLFSGSLQSFRDIPEINSIRTCNNKPEPGGRRGERKLNNICIKSVKSFLIKDRNETSKHSSISETLVLSFTFFKSPSFVMYELFVYFSSFAAEGLFQFYPAITTELGMSPYQSAFLLSLVGGVDIFGKIIFGLLGDCNIMERYKWVMVHQYLLCCACFLSRFATEFWSQVVFAIVIGLFYGTSYSFRSILLVDMFGLPNLLRRLGVSTIFTAMAFSSGPPLIGYTRDITGDYILPLQVIGAIFFASGTSLLAMGCCQKKKWGVETTHL